MDFQVGIVSEGVEDVSVISDCVMVGIFSKLEWEETDWVGGNLFM